MWDLVGNPEDRFSHNEAQIMIRHFDDRFSSDKPHNTVTGCNVG